MYLERAVKPTTNQILSVNIDIKGLDRTLGLIGPDSFTSICFPQVDFGLSRTAEKQIPVVVELHHVYGSLVTFEHEGFHYRLVIVDKYLFCILRFIYFFNCLLFFSYCGQGLNSC